MIRRDIVVIGGSLGGMTVLKQLLRDLPADLPASLLLVTHMPGQSTGYLPQMLADMTALTVRPAMEGQPIEHGHLYVAVPDRHLLVLDGAIALGTGPRENMARPAIDPLFRSAALSFGPRVIGLVLSGLLNDGASGLRAIRAWGGLAVVQHPLDAEADAMPRAALQAVQTDHIGRAAELGGLLRRLAGSAAAATAEPASPSREDLELEVAIAAGRRLGSRRLNRLAKPSALTCPHCQGVLSEVEGDTPLRFRCQIGHGFTAEAMIAAGEDSVGNALRIAMRMMEERLELVTRMARDARDSHRLAVAELYEARAAEYAGYAETLRRAATQDLHLARLAETEEI